MNLTATTFGAFKLYSIETGRFRLDGGAMFGVVPKTLWSRQIDVDENNRILMAMRCLLIESQETGRCYLVDNGIGTKFDDKMASIYQIDTGHSDLLSSLAHHGFEPGDITDLIFTHLHFDHCGGTTYYDESGSLAHRFPDARYHVTKAHWHTATHPNAREKASFLSDNIQPIGASERLHLVDEHHRFEEGLTTLPVSGHTKGQQLPKIDDGERSIVFAADLLPTHVHVPLPWVMGYDMYPARTLQEKEYYLESAVENNWYFYLEHDAEQELVSIAKEDGKYRVAQTLTLDEM